MSSTRTSTVSSDGRFVLHHRIKDSWGDFATYEERWRLVDVRYDCDMMSWSNEGDRDLASVRFVDGANAVEVAQVDGKIDVLELPMPRAFDDTERALRAAVFAEPDDDAPRAVYADWLQQRGDPRGEMIALQLRADAADVLVARHRLQWLCDDGLPLTRDATFERGFVGALHLQVFDLEILDRLLAQDALRCVHALDVSFSSNAGGDEIARRIAEAPFAASLRSLDLFLSGVTDAGVAMLRASPWLSRLTQIKN